MKKSVLCLFFIALPMVIYSAGFSSSINRVNSSGFPEIRAVVKIFNVKPELLKSDNFILNEDGIRISTYSVDVMKQKQYIMLVIDRSSSIKPAMSVIKQAASNFAMKMLKTVSMGVMSFASDVEFEQEFSSDTAKIIRAIQKIRPWGGTALYDALYQACEEINNKAGRNDLKTVICLTDGRDSTPRGNKPMSIKKPEEVTSYAVKNGIRIVTVGLGNDIDIAHLSGFAKSTSGWFLQAKTASQLSQLYSSLSKRMLLEKYYQLKYKTPNAKYDGKKRWLEITSMLKGVKDQGKAFYVAPDRPPQVEIASSEDTKTKSINKSTDFLLFGPDSPFLTGPITVPPKSPVFIPNASAFSDLSPQDCESLISRAEARITEDCNTELDRQYAYLDDYMKHLENMKRVVDKKRNNENLKSFEIARINYRYEILNKRMKLVESIKNNCYQDYKVNLQYYLDVLSLNRKEYVQGQQVAGKTYLELEDKRDLERKRLAEKLDEIWSKSDKNEDKTDIKYSGKNGRNDNLFKETTTSIENVEDESSVDEGDENDEVGNSEEDYSDDNTSDYMSDLKPMD